ncbi:MAG: hydroxymethylbilane synthase [Anaerolineae bacterium]|jgi:hydroxymethylbilane synthase|nr:hydroxymethylbilane synthase [Anaerolineae bacterium]MBT4312675.1 hydroxymethylbilane synthase [Anaerolineae bacterium]MBT4458594.1 hydroxymethylbilane synthase [Anaerolineae bacterium]MBT4843352.1 hydroxymethylbilane synthase [Anaerolineae bacterium]MBT6061471.1 hydroxymethylbilane synthase [Anaerolineae bacterium]
MKLTFATRPSKLARWQTTHVMRALEIVHPDLTCIEEVFVTKGDKVLDKPLPMIGGKGLFTEELEAALLDGRVDAAVHSLKDLPTENPAGLTLGAIPLRADVRDALVSSEAYTLESLPKNARVGTSSPRRAAQLLAQRPDLQIADIRGNVDTRLRKLLEGQYDAVVFAAAGLIRLSLDAELGNRMQILSFDEMLPAPGQGAMAVQCRADANVTLGLLTAIEHLLTRNAVTAERAFLNGLGGGCAVPVAACGDFRPETSDLRLTGLVSSPDGKKEVRVSGEGKDAIELGKRLAEEALAQGAARILNG